MQFRRLSVLLGVLCLAIGSLTWRLACPNTVANAQQTAAPASSQSSPTPQSPAQPQTPATTSNTSPEPITTIKTETRLVLVDSVVTDKKGNYIRDLTAKDFKVWEDNKEQPITSFSFEADAASPLHGQKHYLVLLFDNSSMQMADQIPARQAALKFIEANSGEDRMMAVMDFGGSLHIAQNFTNDTEKLKKVVTNPKFANVSTGGNEPVEVASLSMPQLGRAEADFAVNSLLLALR